MRRSPSGAVAAAAAVGAYHRQPKGRAIVAPVRTGRRLRRAAHRPADARVGARPVGDRGACARSGTAPRPPPRRIRRVPAPRRGCRTRRDGPLEMAPTRATLEGDHDRLRFNVMQGPGQEPLAPGRWRAGRTARPRPGGRRPVACADARHRPRPGRDGGRSRSEPRRVPGDRLDRSGRRLDSLDVTRSDSTSQWVRHGRPGSPVAGTALASAPDHLHSACSASCSGCFAAVTRRNGRRILFSSDSRAELGATSRWSTTGWSSAAWTASTSC